MPVLNTANSLRLGTQNVSFAYLGPNLVFGELSEPENLSPPIVSGAVVAGDNAFTTTGVWGNEPILEYQYIWQVFGTDWANIPGESSSTIMNLDMGEYRSGVRARNSVGWSDWAYSAAFIVVEGGAVAFATFANPNAYITLSDGGNHAAYTGEPGNVGNTFSSHPITQPTYMEFDLISSGNACGVQLYNGNQTESVSYAPFGQWYGEPGFTVMLSPTWVIMYFANNGLPNEIPPTMADDLGFSLEETARIRLAVSGQNVWLWSTTQDAWVGGGNPVTGTAPTVVLPGTGPMRFGAASAATTARVNIINPANFVSAPPTGFTAGVAVPA